LKYTINEFAINGNVLRSGSGMTSYVIDTKTRTEDI